MPWLPSPGNSNCDKVLMSVSLAEVPHLARPSSHLVCWSLMVVLKVILVTQTVIRLYRAYHWLRYRTNIRILKLPVVRPISRWRIVTKLKVTTGCDTTVEMSQA